MGRAAGFDTFCFFIYFYLGRNGYRNMDRQMDIILFYVVFQLWRSGYQAFDEQESIVLIIEFKYIGMAFREKLASDIKTYFKQSRWEDILHDQLVQLLEMRPASPYQYIQKKISLRSKLDSTKSSSFYAQVLIYCLYINPMTTSQPQIQNKILHLCVDKYQHTKLRKNQALSLLNSLLLLSNNQQKQKQYYIKLLNQQIQSQTINASNFSHLIYCTLIYIAMKKQIDQLDQKLSALNLHIDLNLMHQYLQAVQPQISMYH